MSNDTQYTIRNMTDEEKIKFGWDGARRTPPVVELPPADPDQDTRVIVPSRDPEMNGPGALMELEDGQIYYLSADDE